MADAASTRGQLKQRTWTALNREQIDQRARRDGDVWEFTTTLVPLKCCCLFYAGHHLRDILNTSSSCCCPIFGWESCNLRLGTSDSRTHRETLLHNLWRKENIHLTALLQWRCFDVSVSLLAHRQRWCWWSNSLTNTIPLGIAPSLFLLTSFSLPSCCRSLFRTSCVVLENFWLSKHRTHTQTCINNSSPSSINNKNRRPSCSAFFFFWFSSLPKWEKLEK